MWDGGAREASRKLKPSGADKTRRTENQKPRLSTARELWNTRRQNVRPNAQAPRARAVDGHSGYRAPMAQSELALHKASPAPRPPPRIPSPFFGRLGPPTPARAPPRAVLSQRLAIGS